MVTAYKSTHPIRLVTATSLFDGHDASINVMRRLLQSSGAEVIHLGHNRSVAEIVDCAIQEDAQGIAITSYQGGHVEFFSYAHDLLRERGAGHIKLFGGGGGTILPAEMAQLHAYGIARLYSPDDGRTMGLQGMINDLLAQCDFPTVSFPLNGQLGHLPQRDPQAIAQLITLAENFPDQWKGVDLGLASRLCCPVLGITGTGGSGKSSLVDELVRRFLRHAPDQTLAIISVDPSKRKSGGALLGDRIRMNSVHNPRVYMRSLATRQSNLALSRYVQDSIDICQAAGFDLILVETSGIGQSDTEITEHSDVSLYVMTSEYGAATQLEKIDMLDFADLIAINKFDKRGSLDARRDVRKQYRRNHNLWDGPDEALPIYGTIAAQFNDAGMNDLFAAVVEKINAQPSPLKKGAGGLSNAAQLTPSLTGKLTDSELSKPALPAPPLTGKGLSKPAPPATLLTGKGVSDPVAIIPPDRVRYLAEIAERSQAYDRFVDEQTTLARQLYQLHGAIELTAGSDVAKALQEKYRALESKLHHDCRQLLDGWEPTQARYRADTYQYQVRGKVIEQPLFTETLSHLRVPKVALPRIRDWGERLRWLLTENLPGEFPYAAGVFPLKRTGEDPARQFAGEGGAERTNRRFHYLTHGQPARRLSTAFDSVTLYGEDPDPRPDIYGKVGNSGVSVANLDEAKKLYSGFDLCDPATSVSMTINGPAPMILAYFLHAAIDQQCEIYIRQHGLESNVRGTIEQLLPDAGQGQAVGYQGPLPDGHDGLGLLLLGVTGQDVLPPDVYQRIKADTLTRVRGTVQADILKEDQAQNTCIFSTEFALRMMGDIQQYFIDHRVQNFYSVSISGYHIAEAGANPISQLAFTLANGFTFVEYYLARGMRIDDFAPNLSFFFSNGMDPEYAVLGRVARRIWAKAMKHQYGASERSQKLKYHIQTSGRSLHAQEIDFNDIRTTLQALYAIYDNCNSLHTNAYDEAITTPTEESVRRALAIQLIINRELGLATNENPLQGSFIIEELTDLVEQAVLTEFKALSERGGVLGAMERMYQRGKIQDESLTYEMRKHDGTLPIVGVNTFLNPEGSPTVLPRAVIRANADEKAYAVASRDAFQARHAAAAPDALRQLQATATQNGNLFAALMEATKVATLGQLTHALYAVGGQYRRNM